MAPGKAPHKLVNLRRISYRKVMAVTSDIIRNAFLGSSLVSRREVESSVMSPVLWWQQLLEGYSFSAFWVDKESCFPGCWDCFVGRMETKESLFKSKVKMETFLVKREEGNPSGEGTVSPGKSLGTTCKRLAWAGTSRSRPDKLEPWNFSMADQESRIS